MKCYCGANAVLSDSAIIYGRSFGNVWICERYPACDGYVGCHKTADKKDEPLGTLCSEETRRLRKAAHAAFDPLWMRSLNKKHKFKNRKHAYTWLRGVMDKNIETGHIAMFNADECRMLIEKIEALDGKR